MRDIDLENLTRFVTRMGMYIGKETEDSIISFIHGYEIGSGEKCQFTKILDKYLENEYQIPRMSTGWPGKIRELTTRNNKSWVSNFRKVTLEVLGPGVSEGFKEEYNRLCESYQKRIDKNDIL